jgi:hypothetical protein
LARLFDSYVMVDWSAASKPIEGADSIWVGALTPDARFRMRFDAINPSTRAKAKDILIDVLTRLTRRGDKVLLGFDFSLGYPEGTAETLQLKGDGPAWKRMADFLSREMKDKPDNTNNRFPLAARMNRMISGEAFPFWGVTSKKDIVTTLGQKRSRDHGEAEPAEYRRAEKWAQTHQKARPQSVWKLAYTGSVGSQSLTGIPIVMSLREAFPDSRIWPFETGWKTFDRDALESVSIVMAEVYPSLVPLTPEKGEIRDRAQVRVIAESFLALDSRGEFGRAFAPPDGFPEDAIRAVVDEEGWILGV